MGSNNSLGSLMALTPSVLVMLAVYAALLALDVPVRSLMALLGLLVGLCVAAAMWRQRRLRIRAAPAARPHAAPPAAG